MTSDAVEAAIVVARRQRALTAWVGAEWPEAQFEAAGLVVATQADIALATVHAPMPADALRLGGTAVVSAAQLTAPWARDHGLWPVGGEGALAVLRRGRAPRYALARGLSLHGDLLRCARPMLAMRLGTQAAAVVAALTDGEADAFALAASSGQSLVVVADVLEGLSRRGFVERSSLDDIHRPTIAVVVPCHGRPAQTRACFDAIAALDYPADKLEVIAVDDASDPPLAPHLPDGLRVITRAVNGGPGAARNDGVRASESDWVVFVDNDGRPRSDWLTWLCRAFDEPAVDVVGGRTVAADEVQADAARGWVRAFEAARSPLDMGPRGGEVGPHRPVPYLPSCNLAVRRSAFARVDGFADAMRYGEDVDLVWRILETGGRAIYAPDAVVVHDHPSTLAGILGRRAAYASSEADLYRRHPRGRRRMLVPPAIALGLGALAARPLRPVSWALGAGAAALVGRDMVTKRRDLRALGLDADVTSVAAGVLRSQRAAAYHFSDSLLRYYGLPLLAVSARWPSLRAPLIGIGALHGVLDRERRSADDVPPLIYATLYALEMAAYQVGLWRGAFAHGTLGPFLPARFTA